MNKTTTSNTSIKKSLLAGLLDETRATAGQTTAGQSTTLAKAGGVTGGNISTSAKASTTTDPVPVQNFLSDALSKALAAANTPKSGAATTPATTGGFSGTSTAGQTTAGTSGQTQNRLKEAVDAAIPKSTP